MSITINTNQVQYRNSNGEFTPLSTIGDITKEVLLNEYQEKINTAKEEIEQVRDSIPSDYTELSEEVIDLKSAKVNTNQGVAQAGKALIVGQDGLVTTGDAGIPEAVKTSLLNLMRHVAYIDDQGQSYYDALYAALYADAYPRIVATYTPGSHVVYTDDDLDTLREYLTVKRRENAQDSGTVVTDYALSGTLVDGQSTVLVRKDGLSAAVQVEAVDFYNQYSHRWTADGGNLVKINGNVTTVDQDNGLVLNANATLTAARRAFVEARGGGSAITNMHSHEATGYYPVPVPSAAGRMIATVSPAELFVTGRIIKYNRSLDQYSVHAAVVSGTGHVEISFEPAEDLYAIFVIGQDSGTTALSGEPTGATLEFEEA